MPSRLTLPITCVIGAIGTCAAGAIAAAAAITKATGTLSATQ